MTYAKHEPFSETQVTLAAFARALGHPARIAIISFLQEMGEASAGAIFEAVPLAQATVSQHLKALREAGLLKVRPCGPRQCYSLAREHIQHFCHAFQCTLRAN